jgi:hypothetical protein
MYKLFIRFSSGTETEKSYTETELRGLFDKGVKGTISWATVTTPSGTSKDVTKYLVK